MIEILEDPLLECLLLIGKIYNKELSKEVLRSGLPLVNNRLTPQLFIKAAERAGFSSRIVKRQPNKISSVILPVVLVLKDARACVLTKITGDSDTSKKYELVFPETESGSVTLTQHELEKEYSGFSIFIKPVFSFDDSQTEDTTGFSFTQSWFWGTLWRYRKIYFNVMFASFFINVMGIAGSLFVMNVYDRVVPNNAIDTLWVLASGVTIVFFFDFLLRLFRSYLIDKSGKKADVLISSQMFSRIMGLKAEDKPSSSGHFANLIRGYENLREFFTSISMASLIDFPFVFLFIFFIFLIAQWLALIPLVAAFLIITISLFVHIPLKRSIEKTHRNTAHKHALIVESINAFETLKGLCAEGFMQRKMEDTLGSSAKTEVVTRRYSSIATYSTSFIQQMVTVILVVVAVYQIKAGLMSMGGLIACMMLSGRALAPLGQIVSLLFRLQQSRVALKELNKIMALPQECPKNKNYVSQISRRPTIEFQNVSFSYESHNKTPAQLRATALKNISTRIDPSSRIGLVGRVGSGKSTFLKLIMGFYKTTEGAILVDGININRLDILELRKELGYVGQDTRLLRGTLRSNILLGTPWAAHEDFVKASEIGGVNFFSSRHPQGYDLPITEGGNSLSGGQKQSVSIAQTLLHDPEILLMDEPTTSFDVHTERNFTENIDRYVKEKNCSLILATHKPNMLALVDRIMVFDKGSLVVDGPKEIVLTKLAQGKIKRSS